MRIFDVCATSGARGGAVGARDQSRASAHELTEIDQVNETTEHEATSYETTDYETTSYETTDPLETDYKAPAARILIFARVAGDG